MAAYLEQACREFFGGQRSRIRRPAATTPVETDRYPGYNQGTDKRVSEDEEYREMQSSQRESRWARYGDIIDNIEGIVKQPRYLTEN